MRCTWNYFGFDEESQLLGLNTNEKRTISTSISLCLGMKRERMNKMSNLNSSCAIQTNGIFVDTCCAWIWAS